MSKPLVIAIKTAPNEGADAYINGQRLTPDSQLSPIDKPPRTIMDLKSEATRIKRIADWRAAQAIKLEQSVMQKRQALADKAGLHWWTARTLAIAFVDPMLRGGEPIVVAEEDERLLLSSFFALLTKLYPNHHLTGKSKDFEVPFLVGRAMALDVGLPNHLFSRYQITDIHEIFGRTTQSSQRSRFQDYAFGLGIKTPDSIDSTTYLFDQTKLGNKKAWEELKNQAGKEAMTMAEIMVRYHKVFKLPEPLVATEEPVITESTIPF